MAKHCGRFSLPIARSALVQLWATAIYYEHKNVLDQKS
jgi:hypothetical protein